MICKTLCFGLLILCSTIECSTSLPARIKNFITHVLQNIYHEIQQIHQSSLFKAFSKNISQGRTFFKNLIIKNPLESIVQNQPEQIVYQNPFVMKDQARLGNLLKHKNGTVDIPQIKAVWQTLLQNKLHQLMQKHQQYISLLTNKSIEELNNIKNSLDLSFAYKHKQKNSIEIPIKQYAKKGTFLTDLLIPFTDDQKKVLLNNGIEEKYLDIIYMINRLNVDQNIKSKLVNPEESVYMAWQFYDEGKITEKTPQIIVIEKINFEEKNIAPLLVLLNHEIQHTKQSIEINQHINWEVFLTAVSKNIIQFGSKYNELTADILGLLNIPIHHAIEGLRTIYYEDIGILQKTYHMLSKFYDPHPAHRYAYSKKIVESMVTGIVPYKEIPDAWIDGIETKLDQEIKRLQLQPQKLTIPQIPRAKI